MNKVIGGPFGDCALSECPHSLGVTGTEGARGCCRPWFSDRIKLSRCHMSRSVFFSVLLAVVTSQLAFAQAAVPLTAPDQGALSQRLFVANEQRDSRWIMIPYKPNYVLPFAYNPSPSRRAIRELDEAVGSTDATELDKIEIKFQISFMIPLVEDLVFGNGDLHAAYTQVSFWQAYNRDESEGFRDTNYEPELFLLFDTDYDVFGLRNRGIRVGLVHQSNGRSADTVTRSWNRVYASFMLERGNFALGVRPWYRIPEPDDEDENPDIDAYLGYGEVRAVYTWQHQVFSAMLRNNMRSDNRGAVELGWSFPIGERLSAYVQYFNGYGESLLDYNVSNERIGVGVMLSDWL
jgi:phospholipase A1